MYGLLKDTAYPNPAKAGGDIYVLYDAKQAGKIKIVFYSMDGREVKTHEEQVFQGKGKAKAGTAKLSPGIYFYTVIYEVNGIENKGMIRKIVLTR